MVHPNRKFLVIFDVFKQICESDVNVLSFDNRLANIDRPVLILL